MTRTPSLLRLTVAVSLALATATAAQAQSYRFHTPPVKGLVVTAAGTAPTNPSTPVTPPVPPVLVKNVTLSTPSLDFGSIAVDEASVPGGIGVLNTGAAAVSLSTPLVSGPFEATTDCANSLTVGGQCVVNVLFKPHRYGPLTGYVTLPTGAGDKTVQLSGIGLGTDFRLEAALPRAQTYEQAYVGNRAPNELTVAVKNWGNIPGKLAVPALTGANPEDFTMTENCGSVPSEQPCTVTVAFTPKTPGTRSASLSLLGSTVPLTGTAVPAPTKDVNFAGMLNGASILNPKDVNYYGPSPYNATIDTTCRSSWTVSSMLCASNMVGGQSYPDNVATTWSNSGGGARYVVLDLGQSRTFNTAYVYQPNSDGRFTKVQLAVSNSPLPYADVNWTTASAQLTVSDTDYTPQRLSFAPTTARYVRVQVFHTGTTRPSYVEIRALQLFFE